MANGFQPRTSIGFNPSVWDKIKSYATPKWSDTNIFQNAWDSARAIGSQFAGARLATNREYFGSDDSAPTGVVKSRMKETPSTVSSVVTPAAARAQAISDKALYGITATNPQTGRMDIDTKFGSFKNVSPEFARTAGGNFKPTLPGATAKFDTALATQNTASLFTPQNAVIARAQPTPAGMSDNEKMSRYGTRFPDELPINPTWRDIRNQQDFAIRSRLVPTSTTSNAAVGAAQ